MAGKLRHLNVQVDTDLYEEFKELIPWGFRGHLFGSILRLIMDAVREDGQIVIGAVLSGEYKLSLARVQSSDGRNTSTELVNEPTR